MKDTKTVFKFFTITEWKKEENFLRREHKNGWKFSKVNFIRLYHFVKCDPEDVIYQLDYNPNGLVHNDEYIQIFRDCGWEYLQDYLGYSYFRISASEMNGAEEIFCDDSSRLDMIKRVLKGRMTMMISLSLFMFSNICIQSQMDTTINHILAGVFCVLLVFCLILFLSSGYQYWKYWNLLHKSE